LTHAYLELLCTACQVCLAMLTFVASPAGQG